MVSLRFVFLTKEKSRFHQLGPVNVLRPKSPGLVSTCWPLMGLNTVGVPKNAPGLLMTASEKNCGPLPTCGASVAF